MSASTSPSSRPSVWATISKVFSSVFVLSLLGAGWMAVHHLDTEGAGHGEESTAEAETTVVEAVTLSEGKRASAGLAMRVVEPQSIQHIHVVPGRIGYDQTHHIELRTPIDGVLTKVLVKTGDVIEVGQTIAKISSPEIGRARAELLRRESQEKLADARNQRAKSVAANVRQFAAMLEDRIDAATLEAKFENRTMGDYRQTLQPAYVKYQLASELMDNIRPLTGTGALSGRAIRERDADVQVALAEYQAARDQAVFESTQSESEARAELENASRQTEIARQQLQALLGGAQYVSSAAGDLSTLEIRSPMSGTVESRMFAENERVYRADGLFVIADTSALYVSADIREQDWPAVSIAAGAEIAVSVPALPNTPLAAHVHYVGREVQPDTNAVPLIAVVENRDGLLRPGMFARVSVPVGKPKTVLAVPPEAVFQHDNRDFVFVASSEREYQPTPVVCGELRSDDWVEIKSGLTGGERVVEKGVFMLKSEWLLEGEAE